MDEDKKLYNEFLSGNKIAFDNLIGKYQKNVTYFISRYVKDLDAAEDIFQDVVLYLLENQFSYDSKYSFKSYLYIIAKSKAINYIKKHNVEEDISKYENNATQTLLEDVIFSNERKAKIQKVINNLKTDYQIVIYLTQYEEMLSKATLYTGKKHLEREKDRLRIPFIKVNADINYDELCNKYIKGTNAYIDQAIQTVDFELNNYGGFVKSEALIDVYECMSIEEQREFNFTNTFVLFMKEKDKGTPYFALLVNNTDVLVIAED